MLDGRKHAGFVGERVWVKSEARRRKSAVCVSAANGVSERELERNSDSHRAETGRDFVRR